MRCLRCGDFSKVNIYRSSIEFRHYSFQQMESTLAQLISNLHFKRCKTKRLQSTSQFCFLYSIKFIFQIVINKH